MPGSKKKTAATSSAASKLQPALSDAILDMANKKGFRSCVECGATSTPQWREGPMGPKTLCNACGVRRQRMIRKQQSAQQEATLPTAPAAVAQARRRFTAREAPQVALPALLTDDSHLGAASGSEQSSDDTELEWIATDRSHGAQAPPQLLSNGSGMSCCNEEESAAYDLLFFAGVDCSLGASSAATQFGIDVMGMDGRYGRSARRHVASQRRSDDIYYYYPEGAAVEDVEGEGDGTSKRRKVAAAVEQQQHPSLLGQRLRNLPALLRASCSTEAAESKRHLPPPPFAPTASAVGSVFARPASAAPAASDLFHALPHHQLYLQQLQDRHSTEQPVLPAALSGPAGSADSTAGGGSASADSTHGSFGAFSSLPMSASLLPSAPLLSSLPMASLPVLPLSLPMSLPLPHSSASATDMQMLAQLNAEFERACQQLHRANAACEAVSAVVAEQQAAATAARELAAAASQQLATGVQAMADRYKLRDVLTELHAARAAPAEAQQPAGTA